MTKAIVRQKVGNPASEEKTIEQHIPIGYVNRGWISTGDHLLDGTPVGDHSKDIPKDGIERATSLLDARQAIISRMDGELRRSVRVPYVWYSDSQSTFVTEFPPLRPADGLRSDYVGLSASLEVLSPVFESDIVSLCPLDSAHDLLDAIRALRNDVSLIMKADDVDHAVKMINRRRRYGVMPADHLPSASRPTGRSG